MGVFGKVLAAGDCRDGHCKERLEPPPDRYSWFQPVRLAPTDPLQDTAEPSAKLMAPVGKHV